MGPEMIVPPEPTRATSLIWPAREGEVRTKRLAVALMRAVVAPPAPEDGLALPPPEEIPELPPPLEDPELVEGLAEDPELVEGLAEDPELVEGLLAEGGADSSAGAVKLKVAGSE